jgi:hypothetical protein
MHWWGPRVLVTPSTKCHLSGRLSSPGHASLAEQMYEWVTLGCRRYHNPCCKSCAGPDTILAQSSGQSWWRAPGASYRQWQLSVTPRTATPPTAWSLEQDKYSAIPCALKMLLSTASLIEKAFARDSESTQIWRIQNIPFRGTPQPSRNRMRRSWASLATSRSCVATGD